MDKDGKNIYKNARITAGLTQERWSEVLGISVDVVRKYEGNIVLPSDEVVLRMSEVAGQQIVCYWHLLHKSRCAGSVLPEVRQRSLPEVRQRSLPEAVLTLLVRIDDFSRGGLQDLKRLAADGKISSEEIIAYGEALAQLREVVSAAYELEYAGDV